MTVKISNLGRSFPASQSEFSIIVFQKEGCAKPDATGNFKIIEKGGDFRRFATAEKGYGAPSHTFLLEHITNFFSTGEKCTMVFGETKVEGIDCNVRDILDLLKFAGVFRIKELAA